MNAQKLIILGRDGVINKPRESGVNAVSEWEALNGSIEAISRLNHHGYRVIVFTNQPGISSGLLDIQTLHAIHDKMHEQLSILGGQIESILFCPHSETDECECRKPHAGLLLDLQQRLNQSLQGVFVVGDSLEDVQAAQEVDAIPVLVRTGNGQITVEHAIGMDNIQIFNDLAAFANHLLTTD